MVSTIGPQNNDIDQHNVSGWAPSALYLGAFARPPRAHLPARENQRCRASRRPVNTWRGVKIPLGSRIFFAVRYEEA
jgi:hypothetical protein